MQNPPSDQSLIGATHGKALVLLLLCVVLSVLANVYVADTDLIGRLAHAWPPIALALTAHIVWVVRGRSRWVTAITVALLVLVAAVAGAISYVGLQALAITANMSPLAAAWFPLTVDGLGLAAGIAFAAGNPSQSTPAALPTAGRAEQIVDVHEDLDDPVPAALGSELLEDLLSSTAASELAPTAQAEPVAVEDLHGQSEDARAANPTPADDSIPDVDRQVNLVMELLRNDPDLRAEDVHLNVPGVSSLRTAQRRLQTARQALQDEVQRSRQLVAVR